MSETYDAILFVSFGGPEGPDDVIPFLENVLRGKNVPRERMLEVARHYDQFGGVSPINAQNRALIDALSAELDKNGPQLPIYFGNRNWHPLLADTLKQMKLDGVQRAIAFFTSAYSSYSGCRQYREDIQRAQEEVGQGAPRIDKLRAFYNHPGFTEPIVENVRAALEQIPAERHRATGIVFTAHSIPEAMANGCAYAAQLADACELVSRELGEFDWNLTYQSRSGPPSQPWLEPDVCDFLSEEHASRGWTDVVIMPIGFVSDHLEVLFDLDTEARQLCEQLGLNMIRAATVGEHPAFVRMIRELILERTDGAERRWLGDAGPCHDVCPPDCCPSGRRTAP